MGLGDGDAVGGTETETVGNSDWLAGVSVGAPGVDVPVSSGAVVSLGDGTGVAYT